MRARLFPLVGFVWLACGCAPEPTPPVQNGVTVPLFSERCEDRNTWPDEVWLESGVPFVIEWAGEDGCYLDGAPPVQYSVTVSWYQDAADSFWEIWFVDGAIQSLWYGEGSVAGYETDLNPDYPLAQELVEARPLQPGDYRLRVTGWSEALFQGTTGEVVLHAVEGGAAEEAPPLAD